MPGVSAALSVASARRQQSLLGADFFIVELHVCRHRLIPRLRCHTVMLSAAATAGCAPRPASRFTSLCDALDVEPGDLLERTILSDRTT